MTRQGTTKTGVIVLETDLETDSPPPEALTGDRHFAQAGFRALIE